MQGEGQEFESPRLHHLAGTAAPESIRDPLIRVLLEEATDQRTAGGEMPESRFRAGRTLPTGIVIGRKRSLFEIFDFAVLLK